MANSLQFQSILEHILSNYKEETYSINKLCEETGQSRFQVHRIIKSTIGLSFSQLLLRVRILRSVQLLIEQSGNVSEIAYGVGFSSPSYFTKCYTTVFCETPGKTLTTRKIPLPKNSQTRKLLSHPNVKRTFFEKGLILGDIIKPNTVFPKLSSISAYLTFALIIFFLIFSTSKTNWWSKSNTDVIESIVTKIDGTKYINPESKVKLLTFTFRELLPDSAEEYVNEKPFKQNQWVGTGISIGLAEDLGQNSYIISQRKTVSHLAEMIKEAQNGKQDYFLTGYYTISGSNYLIDFVLYNSHTARPIFEFNLKDENLFDLIDSATVIILPKLGLFNSQIIGSVDLPIAEYMTSSFDAFREYSNAYVHPEPSRAGDFDYDQSYMQKAINYDSTFALAGYRKADVFNYWLANKADLREANKVAMANRGRLNEAHRLQILALNYHVNGEPERAIELLELQTNHIEPTAYNLSRLVNVYIANYQFEDALKTQKKLVKEFEIVRDECDLIYYYILAGQLKEARKLADRLLIKYPKNLDVKEQYMRLLMHTGKYDEAIKVRDEMVLLEPENAFILSFLDSLFIISDRELFPDIKEYVGRYQMPESGMKATISQVNGKLRFAYQNQAGSFHYQYKPDHFISTIWRDQTHKKRFVRNKNGKIIKLINHEFLKDSSVFKYALWKEDSLIERAFYYFDNSQGLPPLDTFKKAFITNPEHKYLEPYVKHLEFISSPEFRNDVNERFAGSWFLINRNNKPIQEDSNDPHIQIVIRNDQLIYSRSGKVSEFIMMPISESEAKFHTYAYSNDVLFQITRSDDSLIMIISKYDESSKKYMERGRYKKIPEL